MLKVTRLEGSTRRSLTHTLCSDVPGLPAVLGKAENNENHDMWSWSLLSAQDGGDAETPPEMDAGTGGHNAH